MIVVSSKYLRNAIAVGVTGLLLCHGAWAQKSKEVKQLQDDVASLKTDVQNLATKQQQILDQLAEIKKLLETNKNAAAAPSDDGLKLPETITVAGDPSLGQATARVGIVEFTDFQCPFCGRFTTQTYPKIISDYVDTGKVRFIYRDMPLTSIHPWAQPAAKAAHCADEQGRFWEMHNSLFADQQSLRPPDVASRATKLGLDMTKFNECINSTRYNEEIETSMKGAQRMNMGGTPTFLMGTFQDGNVMKVEKSIVGAYPYEKFQADLDELLTKK